MLFLLAEGWRFGNILLSKRSNVLDRIRIRGKRFTLVRQKTVLDLLLQILEDGSITVASGTEVDLRSFYVVLTSNIGATEAMRGVILGFN